MPAHATRPAPPLLYPHAPGKNWQVAVELAHREGLVLQRQQGTELRSLVSSLLLRLDALAAAGLVTSEQYAVLRNQAWAQDFALIRAYESVGGAQRRAGGRRHAACHALEPLHRKR